RWRVPGGWRTPSPRRSPPIADATGRLAWPVSRPAWPWRPATSPPPACSSAARTFAAIRRRRTGTARSPWTTSDAMSDDSGEVRAVFLEEATELVREIERDLLELEGTPGNRTLVDRLFRHLHTIKGGAGMSGMDELAHYTHAVEGMLDEVRKGSLAMSSSLVSLLLEALDCLKGFMAEAIGEGRLDRRAVQDSHRRTLALMGRTPPAAPPAPA